RLRSSWRRLHAENGVGNDRSFRRHQEINENFWSAAVLPPLSRRNHGRARDRQTSRANPVIPRSTSTTAPITIAPASTTFHVTASCANSHPSNTATIGFTYVCVATSVGE